MDDMTLKHNLETAWRSLERRGAVVRRAPLDQFSRAELQALVWHEERRVRALWEREAPDPPPFDWLAYRVAQAAQRAHAVLSRAEAA